jgi:hypothetical protein
MEAKEKKTGKEVEVLQDHRAELGRCKKGEDIPVTGRGGP